MNVECSAVPVPRKTLDDTLEANRKLSLHLSTLGIAAGQWHRSQEDDSMLKWLKECATKYAEADHERDRLMRTIGQVVLNYELQRGAKE